MHRHMRLYPSEKKRVPLPMVGGVVVVEYKFAAVLLYDGAHYVCVVRVEPNDEETAWVRYDGMSTDGGAQGVGSSCVHPDGANSWGKLGRRRHAVLARGAPRAGRGEA